ncbi:hypothetical protein SELMODRAFT_443366 [Selaginella moellendorffii]|uniref:AP2/ERF domain-containing protein n=1 Tax=Selaginella moellendorffii TaxID=88036 RepID=D8S0S4_SELML|nr:ethylene-responsive transcription factor-like protein At4g13040 isoform X2 [Selaginella moellendorffii]XP_002980728.1 ethylene-responsive transcription factor-like protein At4g13040 isoform X2 [Selaginella moellendorffii]EFJ18379.1 hypothetical protein SELMODRAFT_420254 [Selaginella moellendorffii]EFJ22101.1 hypothetical protein SELMODRAFT_443366 [Selaginella moellendorffii]|eukprot:XP_002976991.1 ethylene-responsive transcription factor-like protein At4g13040 isoform X2 [Selaginella moellendorffii]
MVSIRKRKHLSEKCRLQQASNKCSENVEPLALAMYRPDGTDEYIGKPPPLAFKTPFKDKELKKRKLHRRKQVNNQEPCMLRGVYFKNLKWQAAIKVGKKQVHLGTVNTQEEAAHLYDRAAYMCGREPNFQLTDEEKQELQSFEWEEFLALTRKAIAHKKMQNKLEAQMRRRQAAMAVKTEQS